MSVFIERVNALLSERNLKRVDLLKAANIPESTFRMWIKGSIPNLEVAYRVACFFGVSLESLVAGSSINPPEYVYLSDDENELIDIFRSLDLRGKETLLIMAKGLESQNK